MALANNQRHVNSMQVVFLERYGKYFPGANPLLDPSVAAALIARGVCRPMGSAAPPARQNAVQYGEAASQDAAAETTVPARRRRQ